MTDPTPRPDAVPDVLAAIERVRVSLAGGYVLRFIDPGDVAALLAAHDALTADLARLRAPADLAAIEARAKAARDCGDAGALGSASSFAADVYVLLAHIAATRERHAAEVAAARAAVAKERAALDAYDDAVAELDDDVGSVDECDAALAALHAARAATDAALATKGGGA